MIEMRWAWGAVPAPEIAPDIVRMEKILQYRYPISIEKIPDIGKVHERVKSWSEWIDVPTVTEPTV